MRAEIVKSYDNGAGRACQVVRESGPGVRYRVWCAGGADAAYPSRECAEHAAAHFMATGDLPKEKNAQKAREGADGADGAEVCAGEGKPCGRPAANARNGQL